MSVTKISPVAGLSVTDKRAIFEREIAQLDSDSRYDLNQAGKALRAGMRPVVRLRYERVTPAQGKRASKPRELTQQEGFERLRVGEYEGALTQVRFTKAGKVVLSVAEYGRKDSNNPKKDVFTTLRADGLRRVVLVRVDEPAQ